MPDPEFPLPLRRELLTPGKNPNIQCVLAKVATQRGALSRFERANRVRTF